MRIALVLVVLTVAAAEEPEDVAARFRVAWVSQYEWREDGVENATLDFTYRRRWRSHEDEKRDSFYEGRGQIVVLGHGIVRRHLPGADENRQREILSHLEWVLKRFARAPFEERFQDAQFEGPQATDDGLQRVTVVQGNTRLHYVLDGDRLAGQEWPVKETWNRCRYTAGALGGGYAVLGEEVSWDLGERGKTLSKRHLTAAKGERAPSPRAYRYLAESRQGITELEIDFEPAVFDREHPVVGDPGARDLLADAWTRRYVLPRDLRFEAEFQRRIDAELDKAYWFGTVKGTLQIWGVDEVQFLLDERVIHNRAGTYLLDRRLEDHFRWLVWLLREREFEQEFAGCGFALAVDGDAAVVSVLGHARVLAFRVEKGRVAGYLENDADGDRWWTFRLRKVKGDLARIESVSVKIDDRRLKLPIRYRRHGGIEVPVEFEAVGWGFGEQSGIFGVAKYELKKVKVTRAP